MLAIIASLIGFFSSLIPELLNFLKDQKDKTHELKMTGLQIEAMKVGHTTRLEEVQIKADAEESKYLYTYASQSTQLKWIDGAQSLVRPLITYIFFTLYVALKIIEFVQIGHMAVIWTDDDQGILCAVIGFWFGQQAFSKGRSNGINYGNRKPRK